MPAGRDAPAPAPGEKRGVSNGPQPTGKQPKGNAFIRAFTPKGKRKSEPERCDPPTPPPADASPVHRCSSSLSSTSSLAQMCRICHCDAEPNNPLISPCKCSGSLQFVHQECLQMWIKSSDCKDCELCKFPYNMATMTKPFKEWQKLSMTRMERRKIICSVTFHVVAITCVVWSLYVLIDRVLEEVKAGVLEWPFWTKLIVIAIGFMGGVVFMYVQCKMYGQYLLRWRAYNRIIIVQDCDPAHRHSTRYLTEDADPEPEPVTREDSGLGSGQLSSSPV